MAAGWIEYHMETNVQKEFIEKPEYGLIEISTVEARKQAVALEFEVIPASRAEATDDRCLLTVAMQWELLEFLTDNLEFGGEENFIQNSECVWDTKWEVFDVELHSAKRS